LEKGADINLPDLTGGTALHKAVFRKDIKAIRFLLAHGASGEIKDVGGRIPLDYTDDSTIRELLRKE